MAKGCALSTGYFFRGGLPRNSVDRITDRPDMTSAVDCGRKGSTQTQIKLRSLKKLLFNELKVNFFCHSIGSMFVPVCKSEENL